MIELGNRTICDDGTVILTPDAAMEVMYAGGSLDGAWLGPGEEVTMHNDSNRMLDMGFTQIQATEQPRYQGTQWYRQWTTPEPYASMDVLALCVDRCGTDDERIRVCEEYKLFEERDMVPVLRHLVHMVDAMRAAGVTWGVGRGSSVGSFVLYLIGINRINPLEHGLDIHEFLK